MKGISRVPAGLKEDYARLRRSLARIGYISEGSVVDRAKLQNPRAGYQWTRKVGNKTVTVALSPEQFAAMKQAIENGSRLRKTIREMEALSRKILFHTLPDTRRTKYLSKKDLPLN